MPRPSAALLLLAPLAACAPSPDAPPVPIAAPAEPAVFDECAAALGLEFVHTTGASGELYFPETLPPGAALLDYDLDGDLDVYLVQSGSLSGDGSHGSEGDRLFRNDLTILDGGALEPRFVDVTRSAGIESGSYGMGVAVGDADGDGWPDLYRTALGPNRLWINRRDGTFRDGTRDAGVEDLRWNTSASFLDFDRDGRQDLFVACYKDWSLAAHRPCRNTTGAPDYCGPASFPSAADRLYRNLGSGRFEDVSRGAGLLLQYGAGLGVLSGDFDGNGWVDVYVANDQDPNFLWFNLADGTFLERALMSGTAVNRSGLAEGSMGVDAGDVDGDGDLDLFMTHFRDETNTLYWNDGRGFFRDGTSASRLGQPSRPFTGFGAAFLDFDNDGRLDVVVANGRVNLDEAQRLAGETLPLKEPNQLFRNLGGHFEEISSRASAAFQEPSVGRGLAVGDVDHDGDPDVLIANAHGRPQLFRNLVGQDAGWLGVRTVRGLTPVTGVELRLEVAGGSSLFRVARADGSYLSANDPRVLFGLGGGEAQRLEAKWLEATWPDRRRQRWWLPTTLAGRYVVLYEEGAP